jgi:hypothetical protein
LESFDGETAWSDVPRHRETVLQTFVCSGGDFLTGSIAHPRSVPGDYDVRIRAVRQRLGVSQVQFARRIGAACKAARP